LLLSLRGLFRYTNLVANFDVTLKALYELLAKLQGQWLVSGALA